MTVPQDTAILGVEVPVAEIEKELRQLWEVDSARTNASLMNLAVYSEKEAALGTNSDIVRELTREHACRALLIGLDRSVEEKSIRAWITAHCHLAHGQKSVCCEQIAFHLTGVSRGRFRNTVFAHLQSDLPLVFWWQGDLSPIFTEGLYSRIDRLIIDSSDWSDPCESFKRVLTAIEENNVIVQDLAWTRTYHYRLAVAALYDDPIAQQALAATKQIKIKANAKHRHSALQLLAWFTDLAGWDRAQDLFSDVETKGSYRFSKQNGDLVDVEISYGADCAPIASIEVIADEVTVRVSRDVDAKYLRHELIALGHQIDIHGPADSDVSADLVGDQLSRGGKNSLFRRILSRFTEFLSTDC